MVVAVPVIKVTLAIIVVGKCVGQPQGNLLIDGVGNFGYDLGCEKIILSVQLVDTRNNLQPIGKRISQISPIKF